MERAVAKFLAVLLLTALAAAPTRADDLPPPPYPDVWWQEVPGVVRYFAAGEGDLLVAFTVAKPGQSLDDGERWLEGFFGGRRRHIDDAEFHARYDAMAKSSNGLGTFSNTQRIGFADGSVIGVEEMVEQRDDRWTCDVAVPMMVKRDARESCSGAR